MNFFSPLKTLVLLLLLCLGSLAWGQKVSCPEGTTLQSTTLTGGINDEFEETEPAYRGTELGRLYESWADFDEQKPYLPFGYTFDNFPCGTIMSASLRIYARGIDPKVSGDDRLSLGYDGRSWYYENSFSEITRQPWGGEPMWVTIDLDEQLIELINSTGRLDLLIQDATSVDYVELTLFYCAPENDCNNNCIDDRTDIANGTSQDTNKNNIPDECEEILPEIICPPATIVVAGDGCCGTVTLTPTVVNVEGDYVITNSINSQTGSLTYCFPVGITNITFTLNDYIHAPVSCTTTVVVIDNQGPVITPRQQ